MRLLGLRLLAFGAFRDTPLDFGDAPGLDIVYGDNEAGKSTTLRAIRGLLFGIPEKTEDAYLHPYDRLRIGARLRARSGESLEVVRRKGRKGTLSAPDGSPIPDAALERLLAGIDQRSFDALFGLDQVSLREGGAAMLRAEGDVGQSLFDAAGARGAHDALARLREEADAIHRARAQQTRLASALSRISEAKRRVEVGTLAAESFAQKRLDLDAARAEHRRIVDERRRLQADVARLDRARSVRPVLARRRDERASVDDRSGEPLLPPDARETRVRCVAEHAQASREAAAADERMTALECAIQVCDESLETAFALDADTRKRISDGLGEHRRALQERPVAVAEIEALRSEAVRRAARLGRHPLEGAWDRLAEDRVRKAIEAHAVLAQAVRDGDDVVLERRTERTLAEEKLRELPRADDVGRLAEAVDAARRVGDLDGRVEDAVRLANDARAGVGQALAGCAWVARSSSLEDAVARAREATRLVAPTADELDRLAAAQGELEVRRARLVALDDTLRPRRERALVEQDELRIGGDVPTGLELVEVRRQRDEAFRVLEEDWTGGVEAYRTALERADAVADRLWREADRVARRERLAVEWASIERLTAEHERAQAEFDRTAGETRARLETAFSGWPSTPVDVAEARSWREAHGVLARALAEFDAADAQASAASARREGLRLAMVAALGVAGPPEPSAGGLLGPVLAEAAERVARSRQLAQEHAKRSERVEECLAAERTAMARRDAAAIRLEDWSREWSKLVGELGLSERLTTDEARVVLEELAYAEELRRRIGDQETALARLDSRDEAFASWLRELAARRGWEVGDHRAEALAERLIESDRVAVETSRERERLVREREECRRRSDEARARLVEATAALQRLLDEAGATELAGREAVERRSDERRSALASLAMLDAQLEDLGGGATLDELERLVEGLTIEAIDARRPESQAALAALDERLEAVNRRIGELETSLQEDLQRRSGAENDAAELEGCIAEARRHAEDWVRLRLATMVLEQEIEAYRQRNQGPLLSRAREIFCRLTLGAYVDLRVQVHDEAGSLRCVRSSGDEVPLDALSEGARDQLFLALRLATIELVATRSEPLPLILDDVLVGFDDARVRAALEILSELGEVVQVVYFTHHEHLVALAREALAPGRLRVHRLPSRTTFSAGE